MGCALGHTNRVIPLRLHLFWTGDLPTWVAINVMRWRDMMPNWTVKLWTDADEELSAIAALAFQTAHHVDRIDHIRHGASLVRWWLLHTYGGVWVDTDVTPLLPLDPLLSAPFVALTHRVAAPFVIGGPVAHPLWRTMIDGARSRSGTSPEVTGCWPLTDALRDHPDFRREPPGRFQSHDRLGLPVPIPEDGLRYTTHAWATSSQRSPLRRGNTHAVISGAP
jgi:hypothetical protein